MTIDLDGAREAWERFEAGCAGLVREEEVGIAASAKEVSP